eukprot:6413595-Prymnesium_polylepis.1
MGHTADWGAARGVAARSARSPERRPAALVLRRPQAVQRPLRRALALLQREHPRRGGGGGRGAGGERGVGGSRRDGALAAGVDAAMLAAVARAGRRALVRLAGAGAARLAGGARRGRVVAAAARRRRRRRGRGRGRGRR